MTAPNAWQAADSGYQQHHINCPQCRAAGSAPGTQPRCAIGQTLWASYQQAGMPPHLTRQRLRTRTKQA